MSDWIPVNERLPEEFAPVLAYCPGWRRGSVRNYEVAVWVNPCPAHPDGIFWPDIPITHWQPLPEPPKESDE